MKRVFPLLFVFLNIFLISIFSVNAITLTYVHWFDDNGTILPDTIQTINDGGHANFMLWASTTPSLTPIILDIDLWKDNVFYSNFVDETSNSISMFRTYTINSNDYDGPGLYEVNIEASDDLSTETETLYLNILGSTNTAPYFDTLPNQNLLENSGLNDNLFDLDDYAHDAENDPLTFTILSETNTDVVDCNIDSNNYIDCNVVDDITGNSVVTVQVSDGQLTSTGSFTVYVQEQQNTEPSIQIVAPIENQIIDDTYTLVWAATDPDQLSNTLDIKIEYKEYNSNDWIVLEDGTNNNDGTFDWDTETVNDEHYTIKITAKDDESATSYDDVSIYVDNEISINEPPTVDITSPINFEIISGMYNIEWDAFDNEQPSNTLDVKVEYKEDNWMAFVSPWITIFESPNNPGSHLWNTLQLEDGNYKLRVTVTDNEGEEDENEVMFTINNEIGLNHDPEIISSPITVAYVNQLYSYDVNAIDIDNDELIYMFDSSIPQGMTIDFLTGLITWTPTEEGSHNIVVKVSDEHGAYDTQQYILNVYTQQEPEPQPEINEREKHKFLISNVIAKKKGNYLDLYVDIDNKGNKKENVNLKATILKTGDTVYDDFNLYVYDGYWRQLRFNKPSKGNYVILIEAESSDYKQIKYISVRI